MNDRSESRFWKKVQRDGNCLIWLGSLSADGYGRVYADDRLWVAHRYAWSLAGRQVPEGMQLDHTCWATACVNVEHLRLATPAQNSSSRRGANATNRHTGIRNVYPNDAGFAVRIRKGGALLNFGTYATPSEAEKVAIRERERLFGAYAGGSR